MLLSPEKCTLVCQNRSNQSSVRAATRLSVVQHIHAAHQMERNFLKPAHSRTQALFQLVFYSCEWKPPSCLLMALSDKDLGGWWEKRSVNWPEMFVWCNIHGAQSEGRLSCSPSSCADIRGDATKGICWEHQTCWRNNQRGSGWDLSYVQVALCLCHQSPALSGRVRASEHWLHFPAYPPPPPPALPPHRCHHIRSRVSQFQLWWREDLPDHL